MLWQKDQKLIWSLNILLFEFYLFCYKVFKRVCFCEIYMVSKSLVFKAGVPNLFTCSKVMYFVTEVFENAATYEKEKRLHLLLVL